MEAIDKHFTYRSEIKALNKSLADRTYHLQETTQSIQR